MATVSAQRLLKPRLGMRRTRGIWPPSKIGDELVAGAGALALVAAAGGLAVAGAGAAADALPRLVLVDAAMDVVQIHDSETPRSRSTSLLRAELLAGRRWWP